MKIAISVSLLTGITLLYSCGGNNTDSNVDAPGQKKDAKSKTLELGAHILQSKSPLKRISAYLNGFHFYNGNPGKKCIFSWCKLPS